MATFGEFTVARLGMIASQMALNVTGQNISNINTAGYTRQRLDQYSFITNGSGLYHSNNSASVGSGVMLAGVSQLRDPYLDIRFRKEMSSVGSTEATLGGLEQVLSVINDVNKTGITTQIQDLFDRISRLNTEHVGEQEFDTLVRASANSLCQLLNQTATDLQTAFDNERSIYEQNVQKVDGILEKIQELNEQIRRSDINGDSALELRDQRNTLIDELSSYVKIDVTYDKENLGAGFSVEQLNIKLVNNETNRPDQTLIQGIYRASISFDETDPALLLNISELTDSDGNLASNTASKFVLSDLSFGAAAQGGAATIKLSYTEKDGTAKTKDIQFTITAPTITQGMTMEDKLAEITRAKQATLNDLQTQIGQDADISNLFTVSASSTGVTLVSKEVGAEAASVTKMELQGNATDVIFERAKATAAVKSNAGTITEGMGYGSLESTRRMLTGAGEFRTDGGDTSIRGIPYFVNSLDMIANKFATEMNRVNTTKPDGTAFADTGMDAHKLAGNLFTAKGDDPKNPTQRITASNISISTMWKNGETQIVASVDGKADQSSMNDNITRFMNILNAQYDYRATDVVRTNDATYVTGNATQDNALQQGQNLQAEVTYIDGMNQSHTVKVQFAAGATADDTQNALYNALKADVAFAGQFDITDNGTTLTFDDKNVVPDGQLCNLVTDITFSTVNGADIEPTNLFSLGEGAVGGAVTNGLIYRGNIEGSYANMQGVLGSDYSTTNAIYETFATAADSINTSRDSVSGVDLNEEGINLMQYQKSFAAACRMMTALDECMDKVINGMGVVGR